MGGMGHPLGLIRGGGARPFDHYVGRVDGAWQPVANPPDQVLISVGSRGLVDAWMGRGGARGGTPAAYGVSHGPLARARKAGPVATCDPAEHSQANLKCASLKRESYVP